MYNANIKLYTATNYKDLYQRFLNQGTIIVDVTMNFFHPTQHDNHDSLYV